MHSLRYLGCILATILSLPTYAQDESREDPPPIQEQHDIGKEIVLGAAVTAIESIDASKESKEVRAQKIFDLCTTFNKTAVDARALAFSVFNHTPHYNGTPAKLGTEICLASADGLPTYKSMVGIGQDIVFKKLVRVSGMGIVFPQDLPNQRQYASPWVAAYLTAAGKSFWEAHKKPLRITSLVRTTSIQKKLARQGATPVDCKTPARCGTHTSGASFDISMKELSKDEDTWIMNKLSADMRAGKLLFITERHGKHFHVFMPKPQE